MVNRSPRETVEQFLTACEAEDFETMSTYLADDIVYQNVGLPTINGVDRTMNFMRLLFGKPNSHFGVRIHRIAADGATVLTERTDASIVGRFTFIFWVCGVFEVHDGRITLWRDYFDFFDITKGLVRAVIGAVIPVRRPALADRDNA
ncbi:limonene-1,2-epoxide hydrolase [Mycobacterium sp. E802]|uniref:limonene-1,2-epoxide hydrolase family protein n=1 Tax=Mycobacterium sp. E802 TaxID=1834152 RepID=UPI0007FC9A78|nr:limonene-1,2-epoxide hydrolase family protein [Mycobacterium sp. E802]OBG88792.1 limonene-1,2-epoxide hydrolase [Mycobacterium sp. E802]